MSGNAKRTLAVIGLLAVLVAASGCEITLPPVDCSGINQPDMGGLVCFGATVLSAIGGALAFFLALLASLGGAVPVT
jgi:hypothetical protein